MAGEHESDPVRVRAAAEAWESLFAAQVALMRRFEQEGDFSPLRAREYDVLLTLARAPGGAARLHEINDHVFLSQPSLSRMVERLEQRGLVRRERAPGDARGLLVRLTGAGGELQRHIGRRHVRSMERYLGGALDNAELATLRDLTARLRDAVART